MVSLSKLLDQFKSKNRKTFLVNFFSLSVLQGTNLLLPLITFPYLVRVLGIEKFGLISFALAVVAYFEILTDYGFDLSATRQISINRNNPDKVTSIYSAVLSIKALLSFVSFALLTILVFSFSKFSEFIWVYYFTFGRVIGKSLFPVWFFQGMEKMKYTTYLNILSKTIFTIAIFIFVKDETDYLLVPIFNSLGFVLAGIVAIIQIRSLFGIKFKVQSRIILVDHFKDGWHIFISRVYVNLYTATNTFLLGVFTNNIIVGYYSVAAKIIEALGNLFAPANSALYPYMSKLFHDNVQKFYALIKKINIIYLAVATSLFLAALIFGKQIITLVKGNFEYEIYIIYCVLAGKLLLRPFGPFFTQVFINQGRKVQYMHIVKYTMFANLLVVPVSIYFLQGLGVSIATVLVGAFHIFLFLSYKLNPGEIKSSVNDFKIEQHAS